MVGRGASTYYACVYVCVCVCVRVCVCGCTWLHMSMQTLWGAAALKPQPPPTRRAPGAGLHLQVQQGGCKVGRVAWHLCCPAALGWGGVGGWVWGGGGNHARASRRPSQGRELRGLFIGRRS